MTPASLRIVAIADTHTFQADLGVLPEGDVLIHAGDMLRAGTLEELEPVAEWLNAQPHRHKIIVPGNHDVCFQTQPEQARDLVDALVLEDEGVTLEGIRFWGSPWQPQHDDWAYHQHRDVIGQRWALIPPGMDVLITHTPPRGIGDRVTSQTRVGCQALSSALLRAKPRLHLFGHVHQEGGVWLQGESWLANVTTWESERASTVVRVGSSALPRNAVSTGSAVVFDQIPPADPMAVHNGWKELAPSHVVSTV